MASISGPKCSDLQSILPKISRLRRARGNLITPSRTRAPVGARLVVPTHCRNAIGLRFRGGTILLPAHLYAGERRRQGAPFGPGLSEASDRGVRYHVARWRRSSFWRALGSEAAEVRMKFGGRWRRRRKRHAYAMRLQGHQRRPPRAVQSSALQCRQFESQRCRFLQMEHLSALRLPSLTYVALSMQTMQRHSQRLRHLFSHCHRHSRRHRQRRGRHLLHRLSKQLPSLQPPQVRHQRQHRLQ